MKNLRKALAVVIALTMVMSTVAFAAVFSDVADDASYAEAIELGAAINLFTGYEDGTFKPEGDITRAEFAAIIVRMLGQEAQADGATGTTDFADVPSTHWAAGYINIVSNLGIVNGYGDGNFGPEDNVTYEQAVKMCVVALGYEPAAGGNYPVGYLTIAQQRGITTGVKGTSGVAINRGQVAQMAFNALDVPLMTQTGFGTYIEYVINDGSGTTDRKTLLSENLDIVKLKATVIESYDLSSANKQNQVKIEVVNAYDSIYEDDEFAKGNMVTIDAGVTNIKSLVGYNVILYVSYDNSYDDDPIALYVRKDLAGTDEITIAASDIESVTNVSGDYYEIQYWASETARTTEKIRVDNDVNIYENGQKSGSTLTNVLGADGKSFYGIATFALNDPQGTEYEYDTAYVLDYENAVVDSVNTTAGRVSMKEGNTINYGENYTNVSATLYDEDGNQIEWSTVQENDVISSLIAQEGDRRVYTSTLIRKTVEGVITEVTSDDDTEYRIGDAYYKVDPTIIAADELNLQDEGIFYLDIFGRVAYYDAQSTLTSSYAYVIDSIVEAVSFDNRLQIKAFTFEGEVVTLTGATRITVREGNASAVSYKNADANDTTFGGLLAKIPQGTVITFAVNSQGEISRIGLSVSANNQVGLNYFSQYAAGTDFDYRGNTGIIRVNNRSVEIAEDTIIMIANTAFEDDDFDLLSLSLLGEEDILEAVNTTAYDVDKNMVAGLIIVNGQIDVAGRAEGLAFVTGTSQIKDDYGDNLDRLTVLQGGASKQIDVSDALSIDGILFKAIAPTLNAKGLMSSFKTIAAVDATGNLTTGNGFVNDDYVEYVVGKVVDKTGSRITVNGVEGNGDAVEDMLYSIPNTANIYLYNDGVSSRALKARLVDDLGIFDVDNDEYFDEYGNKLDEVDVLIRYYDGKIQDVVIYLDTTYAAPAAPAE